MGSLSYYPITVPYGHPYGDGVYYSSPTKGSINRIIRENHHKVVTALKGMVYL